MSQNKTWSFHSGGHEIACLWDIKQYSLVEMSTNILDGSVVFILLSQHEDKENTRNAYEIQGYYKRNTLSTLRSIKTVSVMDTICVVA
jgi:hypothetical protein